MLPPSVLLFTLSLFSGFFFTRLISPFVFFNVKYDCTQETTNPLLLRPCFVRFFKALKFVSHGFFVVVNNNRLHLKIVKDDYQVCNSTVAQICENNHTQSDAKKRD